jgi:hypothetical protein
LVIGGRFVILPALALLAGSCVESGNYGWDLGRWQPPLSAEAQVEAFRGVHEGRIGLVCRKGGAPTLFVETWRPLVPEGAGSVATMTYRVGEAEFTAAGMLDAHRFEVEARAADDVLMQVAAADEVEVLVPVNGGGVYPITFDVSELAQARDWVRAECQQL